MLGNLLGAKRHRRPTHVGRFAALRYCYTIVRGGRDAPPRGTTHAGRASSGRSEAASASSDPYSKMEFYRIGPRGVDGRNPSGAAADDTPAAPRGPPGGAGAAPVRPACGPAAACGHAVRPATAARAASGGHMQRRIRRALSPSARKCREKRRTRARRARPRSTAFASRRR